MSGGVYFTIDRAKVKGNIGKAGFDKLAIRWALGGEDDGETVAKQVELSGKVSWGETFHAKTKKSTLSLMLIGFLDDQEKMLGAKQCDLFQARDHEMDVVVMSSLCKGITFIITLSMSMTKYCPVPEGRASKHLGVKKNMSLCKCAIGALYFPRRYRNQHTISNVITLTNTSNRPVNCDAKCTFPEDFDIVPRLCTFRSGQSIHVSVTWVGKDGKKEKPDNILVVLELSSLDGEYKDVVRLTVHNTMPDNPIRWRGETHKDCHGTAALLAGLMKDNVTETESVRIDLSDDEDAPPVATTRTQQGLPVEYSMQASDAPIVTVNEDALTSHDAETRREKYKAQGRTFSNASKISAGSDNRSPRGSYIGSPKVNLFYHVWVNKLCYSNLALSKDMIHELGLILPVFTKDDRAAADSYRDRSDSEALDTSRFPLTGNLPDYHSMLQAQQSIRPKIQTQFTFSFNHFRLMGLYFTPYTTEPSKAETSFRLVFKHPPFGWEIANPKTSYCKIDVVSSIVHWTSPLTIVGSLDTLEVPNKVEIEVQLWEDLDGDSVVIGRCIMNLAPYINVHLQHLANPQGNQDGSDTFRYGASATNQVGLSSRISYFKKQTSKQNNSILIYLNELYSQTPLLTCLNAMLNFFIKIESTQHPNLDDEELVGNQMPTPIMTPQVVSRENTGEGPSTENPNQVLNTSRRGSLQSWTSDSHHLSAGILSTQTSDPGLLRTLSGNKVRVYDMTGLDQEASTARGATARNTTFGGFQVP